MDNRSRNHRKVVKLALRQAGVTETELGELKVKTTKAEARRRLLLSRSWVVSLDPSLLVHAEQDILDSMAARVRLDIDAEVMGSV